MGVAEKFDKGETVAIMSEIKDPRTGDRVAPDTIKVTIYDAAGEVVLDGADMLPDADITGEYYYHFDTAERDVGTYSFIITASRGGKVTIDKSENNLFVLT